MNTLSRRQRDALADRARREHWERCANNKTYEQWREEYLKDIEQDATKSMLVQPNG